MHARPATIADAPEVVRLGALMFESIGDDPDGPWRARADVMVRNGLADGTVVAFVVDGEEPGRLAASAAGTVAQRLPVDGNPGGRVGYVQYVYTEASRRCQGLGRLVMDDLLDWYRENDVGVVELHASGDGEPLYRAMGFVDPRNPQLRLRL